MAKKFIICPNCEKIGLFKPLGEISSNGDFLIKRRLDYTVITGSSFDVRCGNCNELVYRKTERGNDGTIRVERQIRILGVGTFSGTFESGASGTISL